jgi:hypothetical protein
MVLYLIFAGWELPLSQLKLDTSGSPAQSGYFILSLPSYSKFLLFYGSDMQIPESELLRATSIRLFPECPVFNIHRAKITLHSVERSRSSAKRVLNLIRSQWPIN